MIKDDVQLKQDVEDELRWDPRVRADKIDVRVNNGVVSLLGAVGSYAQKRAAEEAGRRVGGLLVVTDELTVTILGSHRHEDAELAQAALSALKWNVLVPKTVTAKLRAGCVTLEGRVDWNYQRDAAEQAVSQLEGITSLLNTIKVKATQPVELIRERVEAALQRQGSADFHAVHVATSGGTVTLSGSVSSRHALDDAIAAAWSAPGVIVVLQELQVCSGH